MDFFSVLTLFGGLAIFLFGMNVMGDGLEKFSGSRLKSILENLTSSPIRGVLLGTAVTAIIQSSSATTVMAVGFVNSGLMKLSQAVGIIMGANVGTTVTAWLLSLTGIESSNFFVQLLNPSSFAPILSCIGIFLIMFTHSEKKHSLGSVFVGFGLLMTGMEFMSDSVRPLADIPEFQNILTLFKNPVLGVLTGALLTAVIQSSSASVGILQALSVTGSITYAAAVPIIMGQNIGTCVTAILSSIGTSKNAKRTAAVHLLFNVIGTVLFLLLYYIANAILRFPFHTSPINAAGIAIVHTIFNILSTVVMLPFARQLERLAYIVIPEDDIREHHKLLDERLFRTPSIAVQRAKDVCDNMAMYSIDSLEELLKLFNGYNETAVAAVGENEAATDRLEDKIGTYLIRLSRQNLSVSDSGLVSNMLHAIGDFERIADLELAAANSVTEAHTKKLKFSDSAIHEMRVLSSAVYDIVSITVNSFVTGDTETAKDVEPLDRAIDRLVLKIRRNHIRRLKSGTCGAEIGFILADMLNSCSRIAAHCSNVAVSLIQAADDSYDTHEYLNSVKYGGENNFNEKYNSYKAKYML